MISIPAYAQIEGITIFRDDVVPHQFYYLPRQPKLLRSEAGKPMFTFMRYQFPLNREGAEPGGGYLVFTTQLSEDQALLDGKVKSALATRLRAENPLATTIAEPALAPVDFTNGTARLIMMKDAKMIKSVDLGSPSLLGLNTMSVALELSSDAATLFYESLRRGGTVAALEYDLKFPVRLPAVQIIGRVNAKQVKEVVMKYTEQQLTDGSVWGDDQRTERKRTSLSETMHSQGLVQLDILKGSVDLSEDEMESLRAFAFRSMDEFIKKHFLTGPSVETADDRKSEWMEFIQADVTASFDLNVSFRDVITRDYSPSAQIDASFIGRDVADVAFEIDLNNAPWFFNTLTVQVDTNLDFEAYGDLVHSVVGHFSYDQTGPNGRIVKRASVKFTKNDREKKKFETRIADLGKDEYHVDIEVNYRSGPRLQTKLASLERSVRDLTLTVPNPGVMEVKFSAAPAAFETNLVAIEVEIEYADPKNGVEKAVETIVLTKETNEKDYRRVLFAPFEKPYRYRATYVLTEGNQRSTTPWFEVSQDTRFVNINTPFDQEFSLTVLASADYKSLQQIIVDLEYVDRDNDFRQATSLSFQQGTPQKLPWKFPIRNPELREFTYTETWVMTNNAVIVSKPKTLTSSTGSLIVGNAPGGVVTIEVDPADIGIGGDVTRAIVRLTYSDVDNDLRDTETLVFRDAQPKSWVIARADARVDTYSYEVEYFLRTNERKKLPEQTGRISSISDILILPPPPAND